MKQPSPVIKEQNWRHLALWPMLEHQSPTKPFRKRWINLICIDPLFLHMLSGTSRVLNLDINHPQGSVQLQTLHEAMRGEFNRLLHARQQILYLCTDNWNDIY